MAKSNKGVDEAVLKPEVEAVLESSANETEVVLHLDRDPNDPRTREPAQALPSLNDEGQS